MNQGSMENCCCENQNYSISGRLCEALSGESETFIRKSESEPKILSGDPQLLYVEICNFYIQICRFYIQIRLAAGKKAYYNGSGQGDLSLECMPGKTCSENSGCNIETGGYAYESGNGKYHDKKKCEKVPSGCSSTGCAGTDRDSRNLCRNGNFNGRNRGDLCLVDIIQINPLNILV